MVIFPATRHQGICCSAAAAQKQEIIYSNLQK